ncbi:MAG TPA: hypothetical protein VGK05_06500 [Acidimicrobiia bacterium]|jgi:hypothetical protein
MAVQKNPTPGEIVVMAGAGVAFLFSFFPFYSGRGGIGNTSAWGSGLFPVATLIVLFAVAAGVVVALVRFANVQYPRNGFLGFGFHQLLLALTSFATILALAFLIVDNGPFYRLGFGFWFVFIGATATLVGAVIMMNDAKTRA